MSEIAAIACDCVMHDSIHGAMGWSDEGSDRQPSFCDQVASIVFTRNWRGEKRSYSCEDCFAGMKSNFALIWGTRGVPWSWSPIDAPKPPASSHQVGA